MILQPLKYDDTTVSTF